MKFIKKYPIPISIVFSGILISILIWYRVDLDALQKIWSIVGSLSLGIALAAYIYKKNQDKKMAAIEQIAFFRKEIIPEWTKVSKELKSKNSDYKFPRIKLDESSLKFMRKKYSINFKDQMSVFLETKPDLKIDPILDSQILVFNMLEEFSLRVFYFGTNEHQALSSVQAPFVEIIEKNAAALVFVRDVITGNAPFSATLSLYNLWKDGVNRELIVERLEGEGFITEDEKKEIINRNKSLMREREKEIKVAQFR